jgi:hypothetical protein
MFDQTHFALYSAQRFSYFLTRDRLALLPNQVWYHFSREFS